MPRSVHRASRRRALLSWLLPCCALLVAGAAGAVELPRFLPRLVAGEAFPGAGRLGAPEGEPPVATAFAHGERLGYVFVTTDYLPGIGYSGKPIHLLVAIGNDAVIRKVTLLEHHEPIVLVGIPEARIRAMLERYAGLDIRSLIERGSSAHDVDIVSGATVTALVIDDSVIRAAIAVTRRLGLGADGQAPPGAATAAAPGGRTLDPAAAPPSTWQALLVSGWVRGLRLTVGDVNRAFARVSAQAAAHPEAGADDELFTELFVSLVTPEAVGTALLGPHQYRRVRTRLQPGEQAILLAGRGRYSFKGSGYVRGGIFERFRVLQGDRSIIFHDHQYLRLRRLQAAGAPERMEVDVFFVPADAGFDPHQPWQVELLVHRRLGPTEKAFARFTVDYPALARPAPAAAAQQEAGSAAQSGRRGAQAPAEPALWKRAWRAKVPEIIVLGVALALLSAVFFFQMWFARRPRLLASIRVGFLLFTLFGIGWYAKAQLSVVNILTVFNAWLHGFRWEYFLMDPLVFILWGSVFVSLILWGRGAYCGWLCPFGALQELTNRVARVVGVPQWRVPWPLHERLWALKYLIFLALFGTGIHSLATAERLAEVEPFKTAIIMGFVREWPFVTFAVALLVAGLFMERFYCRYLCPLGAALAIPARLRTFEWLKRYRQCGAPCQICANECMVQAIHPEGPINPHECLYCLHCQELYVDDQRCPVAIAKRERRERREARGSADTRRNLDRVLGELRAERARRDDP